MKVCKAILSQTAILLRGYCWYSMPQNQPTGFGEVSSFKVPCCPNLFVCYLFTFLRRRLSCWPCKISIFYKDWKSISFRPFYSRFNGLVPNLTRRHGYKLQVVTPRGFRRLFLTAFIGMIGHCDLGDAWHFVRKLNEICCPIARLIRNEFS